jgi:hypothetical protein
MIPVQVQTPTFFFERAIDRLASKFPAEGMERLKANLRAFRAWVAEPAYREQSPEDAVEHVLKAVGPAVQLRAEFLATLASVPRGFELFLEAVTEDLADMVPEEGTPELVEAANLLQRAQRVWVRFIAFHPDLAEVERSVGSEQIGGVLTLGFHSDNLLTICLMATDGLSAPPSPQVLDALSAAALDHARQYHQGVRSLVEAVAPEIDTEAPFESTTVADLLSLPPYDGPAATVEEMEEAIGALFGAS